MLVLDSIYDPLRVLFVLRLYIPVNIFSVMSGRFPGLNKY